AGLAVDGTGGLVPAIPAAKVCRADGMPSAVAGPTGVAPGSGLVRVDPPVWGESTPHPSPAVELSTTTSQSSARRVVELLNLRRAPNARTQGCGPLGRGEGVPV